MHESQRNQPPKYLFANTVDCTAYSKQHAHLKGLGRLSLTCVCGVPDVCTRESVGTARPLRST